ncbi:MAG: sulfite exporter TauE/SafE family protein [Myxococcota bacterium]
MVRPVGSTGAHSRMNVGPAARGSIELERLFSLWVGRLHDQVGRLHDQVGRLHDQAGGLFSWVEHLGPLNWGPVSWQGAMIAGALAGVLAIPHCAAMCGPLAAFACRNRDTHPGASAYRAPQRSLLPSRLLRYQLGRLLGYAAAGAFLGSLGEAAWELVPQGVPTLLSWTFALGLCVAALRLLRAPRFLKRKHTELISPSALLGPKSSGSTWRSSKLPGLKLKALENRISRLGLPFASLSGEPLLAGILTAGLPCGALYGVFLMAAGTGQATFGSLTLLCFAATSTLGTSFAGWAGAMLSQAPDIHLRRGLAATFLIGSVLLVLRAAIAPDGAGARCHTEAGLGATTEIVSYGKEH